MENNTPRQGSWAGVVAKRSYTLQHGSRSTVPAASYSGSASQKNMFGLRYGTDPLGL